MKNIILILFLVFPLVLEATTVSGVVKDKTSGEYIVSATAALFKDSTNTKPIYGAYSNRYGFFSIAGVDEGQYILKISYIGKKSLIDTIQVESEEDIFRTFDLEDMSVRSDEVVVTAEKDISSVRTISTVDIDPEYINKLPAIGGEKDVFRILQLLPGVHQGSELSSGLYVRGGTPDQNLVLLDGVTVYNPTHLGGFLSSFNADALRNITLIKGAFPAEYGGRLSSVLDMSMKEGTKEDISGTAALSLISAKATLEGPITENSTFMVSARRMYLDVLIGLGTDSETREQTPNYYFYDYNLKTNIQLSEKDRLFVSGFFAKDVLDSPSDDEDYFDIGWGNTTGNLRWMHIVSPELFTNFSMIYTNYNFSTRLGDNQTNIEFRTDTGIEDFTLRGEAEYFPDKDHKIKTGIDATYHNFKVNTIEGIFTDIVDDVNTGRNLNSFDLSYYLQDEWSINDRLNSNIGVRFNLFTRGGYFNVEPRLSFKYSLDEISFLKAAFGIANQPMHLVYRNEVNLPTDAWIPVSDKIRPGRSYQGVLGYERTLWDDYFFSIEGYYKDMQNIYEYSDTVSTFSSVAIEDQLTRGRSDAWGIELFLEKKVGRLKGWIGYTFSRTLRYFDDLNNGKAFAPRHDRTHDAKIVAIYEISDGWEIGASWIYGTGQAYTVPVARRAYISTDGDGLYRSNYDEFEYSDRNGYRMPAYHRMDVNFMRKFEWFDLPWEWSINVYNVYNRQNPFAVYLDQDWENDYDYVLKQISLFPIIPTFGLSVKF
jgi:hypothetical protein